MGVSYGVGVGWLYRGCGWVRVKVWVKVWVWVWVRVWVKVWVRVSMVYSPWCTVPRHYLSIDLEDLE